MDSNLNPVGHSQSVSPAINDFQKIRDGCSWYATRYVYPNHWFPGTQKSVIPLVRNESGGYVSHLRRKVGILFREVIWTLALVYSAYLILRKLFVEKPECP